MNDDEVKKMFEGCEGFVFAAGVDERVEGPRRFMTFTRNTTLTR